MLCARERLSAHGGLLLAGHLTPVRAARRCRALQPVCVASLFMNHSASMEWRGLTLRMHVSLDTCDDGSSPAPDRIDRSPGRPQHAREALKLHHEEQRSMIRTGGVGQHICGFLASSHSLRLRLGHRERWIGPKGPFAPGQKQSCPLNDCPCGAFTPGRNTRFATCKS